VTVDLDRRRSMHVDPAIALVVVLVIATHLLALGRFPQIGTDEGGWPMAVRIWLTTGHATFDYYQTPAYHWALGLPFWLWGTTVAVGRLTSGVVSLISLAFFAGLAWRLFGDRRAVLWAVLLLGVDYGALTIDRRALVEPFELCWMNALAFFYLGRGRRNLVGVAIATAGLLLTKASGAFILVALVLGDLLDVDRRPAGDRDRRPDSWMALGSGVVVALAVFAAMYATHPSEFARGWWASLQGGSVQLGETVHDSTVLRLGFIVIDLQLVLTILRAVAASTPFAFALGAAGGLETLVDRRWSMIGWWSLGGLACNLIQAVWLDNHIAVVYPALALGTVVVLLALDAGARVYRVAGVRFTWASVLLAAIVLYNLGIFLGGVFTTVEPSQAAVGWLRTHERSDDVVLTAPYIAMQRTAPMHTFWELARQGVAIPPVSDAPFVPSLETLDEWHVRYLVVDRREWGPAIEFAHADSTMRSVLSACCRRVYPDSTLESTRDTSLAPPAIIYERTREP
jgi:Dolichyl-phosphate-mannose-protein mannosyltransferase